MEQASALPDVVDKTEAVSLLKEARTVSTPPEQALKAMSDTDFEAFTSAETLPASWKLSYAPLNALYAESLLRVRKQDAERRETEREAARQRAKAEAEAKADAGQTTGSSGILFYDPNRTPPYMANERSSHTTRQAAIEALANQFEESTAWVEANMGQSNDLGTIHRNLVAGKLAKEGTGTSTVRQAGEVNHTVVDKVRSVWQRGGWRNKSRTEQARFMAASISEVTNACPNAADREATLDYIQAHIGAW